MTVANPLTGVRAILLADAAVSDLVSTRVYSGEVLPADIASMPRACVVLNPSGGSSSPGTLGNYGASRIDTLCYGGSLGEAWSVYLAVYAALKHAAPQTAGGVQVMSVRVLSKGALGTDPETQWPVALASFSALTAEVV